MLVAVTNKLDKRLKLFAQLSKKGFLHVGYREFRTWYDGIMARMAVGASPEAKM